jgi:hypothetical protein
METTNCSHIRESLIRRLSEDIEVSVVSGQCVFTLPIQSLDARGAEVFIEKQLGDTYRVHDAGITTSHLFAQGIHITEHKTQMFEEMARRLGATYMSGVFEAWCKESELQDAILSVGQCAAMATMEIASHKPIFEEEPVSTRVERSLNEWKPEYVKQIGKRVPVKGRKTRHSFDFVSFPKEPRYNPVALQILAPSHSSQAQAERYGFLVLDTEGLAPYDTWRRFAIITKAETWGDKSLELVRDLSEVAVPLVTGHEAEIEKVVPRVMEQLSTAA